MKQLFSVILFIYLIAFTLSCNAENSNLNSSSKIQKLTEEQINNLPAIDFITKLLMNEKNKQPNLAFQPQKTAIAMIEVYLNTLKFYNSYPTGKMNPALIEAIKEFQTSINKNATGVLLVGEFSILVDRVTATMPGKISPLTYEKISFFSSSDFIHAKGIWNQKIYSERFSNYPIQLVNIVCVKYKSICIESDSNIIKDENSEFKNNSFYLDTNTKFFNITKWTDSEINADNYFDCFTDTLIIDTTSKEVYLIERKNSDASCTDNDFGSPKIIQLIGGFNKVETYFENRNKTIRQFYNKNYFDNFKHAFLP